MNDEAKDKAKKINNEEDEMRRKVEWGRWNDVMEAETIMNKEEDRTISREIER